jgi:hypothetical protein
MTLAISHCSGTFRLSQQALQEHGPIQCTYQPILQGENDFATKQGARIFPFADKTPLVSDFFQADCRAHDGSNYSNIHSGIIFNESIHIRWVPRFGLSLALQK